MFGISSCLSVNPGCRQTDVHDFRVKMRRAAETNTASGGESISVVNSTIYQALLSFMIFTNSL